VDQFHDEKAIAVFLSIAEDGHDAGVMELLHGSGFAFEASDPFRHDGHSPWKYLHRHHMSRAEISGSENDSHATASQFLQQFTVSESGEGDGSGHILSNGACFFIDAGVFEHGEDGEDIANTFGMRREAFCVEFDGRLFTFAKFIDKLRHKQFEGFAGPNGVSVFCDGQPQQVEIEIVKIIAFGMGH
jgi:hypothetical protein